MKDNLIARQLRRLGLAYEIQKVANPILKRGDTSQTSIYYNEILKKFAVCENTFRSLVKLKEAEKLNSSSKCNGIHINNLFKFFVWCEVSKSFTRSII